MSYHIYYWWKGRMIFEKKNPPKLEEIRSLWNVLLVSQPEPETGNAFAQMCHYTPLPRQGGQKTTKDEKWVVKACTMDYWTFSLLTPHFADHSPRLTLKPAVSPPQSSFFVYLFQSPEASRLEKDKQERQTRKNDSNEWSGRVGWIGEDSHSSLLILILQTTHHDWLRKSHVSRKTSKKDRRERMTSMSASIYSLTRLISVYRTNDTSFLNVSYIYVLS